MKLPEYRELALRLMAEANKPGAIGIPFKNFGKDHAKTVFDIMLANAKSVVEIFANSLSLDVFDPIWFRDLILRCPGVQIRILTRDPEAITNTDSALSQLRELVASNRIEWHTLAAGIQASQASNVTVVDNRYARLEEDQGDRLAQVVFGPHELVDSAANHFNSLWGKSVRGVILQ